MNFVDHMAEHGREKKAVRWRTNQLLWLCSTISLTRWSHKLKTVLEPFLLLRCVDKFRRDAGQHKRSRSTAVMSEVADNTGKHKLSVRTDNSHLHTFSKQDDLADMIGTKSPAIMTSHTTCVNC